MNNPEQLTTYAFLQRTGGKDESNIIYMRKP